MLKLKEPVFIMNRLYTLDYLRGIAAFMIMIYHYLFWAYGSFSSENFMGRVGVYGVSIFYVLSGLTLYYVYYTKMLFTKNDIFSFFKKRIFRIFPLLWLATIISIILSKKVPDFLDVFLNLSGLFGFVKWGTYFSTGVWSIGNELVFYVFFPFFVFFTKSHRFLMLLLCVIIILLYVYFAFYRLDPNIKLSEQWKLYINPLNQVFLFLGGFLIGHFLHKIKMSNYVSTPLLISGILLFVFIPAKGDTINIITGMNRIYFTLSCFLICIGFYKTSFVVPDIVHKPLIFLGDVSYSVYLLHSIIFTIIGFVTTYMSKYLGCDPNYFRMISSLILTLIVSHFVSKYFEKYFIKKAQGN